MKIMPTLIKLKRSVTGNPLQPAQLNVELDEGEPFVDTYSKALVVGGKKDGGTKDRIGSHYVNDVWVDTYQPLVRSDENPVVIGNTERRVSLNSFDRGTDDKGLQLNVDSGYALEINGVVLRGIESEQGSTTDYGDKYVYIGGNNEYNNVALTSHGTSSGASPYGIMSITNTNSDFRDFVRLRFHNDGNVSLIDYIGGSGTPSTPIRNFKVHGLNTMQRGGYFSIDGQVNDGKYGTVLSSEGIDVHGSGKTTGGTQIRSNGITSASVVSDSITPYSDVLSIGGNIDLRNYRSTGSVYQPIYINGEGNFSACSVMYRHIVTITGTVTIGGQSTYIEVDFNVYNSSPQKIESFSSFVNLMPNVVPTIQNGWAGGNSTAILRYGCCAYLYSGGTLTLFFTNSNNVPLSASSGVNFSDSVIAFTGSRIL